VGWSVKSDFCISLLSHSTLSVLLSRALRHWTTQLFAHALVAEKKDDLTIKVFQGKVQTE